MRLVMGGWVLVRSWAAMPCFLRGFMMYMGAVAREAARTVSLEDAIFSRALASPSG